MSVWSQQETVIGSTNDFVYSGRFLPPNLRVLVVTINKSFSKYLAKNMILFKKHISCERIYFYTQVEHPQMDPISFALYSQSDRRKTSQGTYWT